MKEIYFKGVCKWAKVQAPDNKYKSDEKEYSVDMYLDDDSWELFNKSELQLEPREDDDGRYIKFRRGTHKFDGTPIPPLTVLHNGVVTKALVGNGSEATCKVIVYDTEKGKGHRLEAINVTDLEEFEGAEVEVMGTPF